MLSTAGTTPGGPLSHADALEVSMFLPTGHVGYYIVCAKKQRCLAYIKQSMCTYYIPLLPPIG